MKKLATAILGVLLVTGSVCAASKFLLPTQGGVGIYKNEVTKVNEAALVTVGTADKLTVLSTGKDKYQVKTADGTKGWVEKRLVTDASGKSFAFDDADVIGYLDNPTPIYIIDADNKDQTPITLDRSFADALKQNADRESIERQAK